MKDGTILHDVMREISVLSTIHYRPDSGPSCRQSLVRPSACIYTLLPTKDLYVLSCFLALLIVDGHVERARPDLTLESRETTVKCIWANNALNIQNRSETRNTQKNGV